MNKITRSPQNDVSTWFNRGVDDIFEGFFKPIRSMTSSDWQGSLPALDIVEHKKNYVVTAEMPGMDKNDIEITIDNGLVTISGEKTKEEKKEEDGKVICSERSYGKYLRQFRIGSEILEDKIEANYKKGVLTLTIPKKQESAPQTTKIEVK